MPAVLWKINGRPEGARPPCGKPGGEGALRALNPLGDGPGRPDPGGPRLGSPRVIPAPSPAAKKLGREVSRWVESFSRAE